MNYSKLQEEIGKIGKIFEATSDRYNPSSNEQSMLELVQKSHEELEKSQKFTNSLLLEAQGLQLSNVDNLLKESNEIEEALNNQNFLESATKYTDMSKRLNNNLYSHKLGSLTNLDMKPLPENRNYAQEMLNEFKLQNERFNIVIENLERQNKLIEQQLEQDQLSSEKQIIALEQQLDDNKKISDQNNKNNKIMISITLFVAFISIIASIYTVDLAIDKTEEIYQKENNSSTLQNYIVNNKLDELNLNTNNKQLIKNIEKQTIILNRILEELKKETIQ